MTEMFEVPGETSPMNQSNVLNALVLAASATQHQVQAGTKQLQHWEKQKMYYPTLQEIFVDYSLPTEVRSLAIIQLKNGIDRYWRKTAPNAIVKEEKEHIKTKALEAGILEPERRLALQNALMVAKILRYEYPRDWPDAISTFLSFLRSATRPDGNHQELSRALLLLLQIIKELSTARLQRSRRDLQSIAPELLHVLASIYMEKVGDWSQTIQDGCADQAAFATRMEQSLMSLRIIRRLIIYGYENPVRQQEVKDFWQLSCQHFDILLSFSPLADAAEGTAKYPEPVYAITAKHILQLSKLHVEMAKQHPASFALFPNCIEVVHKYWTVADRFSGNYANFQADSDSEGQSLPERVVLFGLLLVRACLKMILRPAQTFKYPTQQDKEERQQALERLKTEVFNQDFVVAALEPLVTYLRFRNVDFQEWESEPESWVQQEEFISDTWEFSIRACSEKVFLDLVIRFKDVLVPRLLNVFQNFANTENHDVLTKDSLYSAVGLAAASLEEHLDINNFLEMTMVPEVQIQKQEYKLLRRRIPLVLGEWAPIKYESMNKDAIFQIFLHLLNKDDPFNDLVVRITTARQLRVLLDFYRFELAHFMPYAESTLGSVMALIQDVELSETKRDLLETVRMAVVKMENHIAPFADSILSLLPPLWEESGEEHLTKQAILNLLTALIHSLKQDSVRYHPLILPLIQSSVDPKSEASSYLLEEALELWAAILVEADSATSANSDILSLLPAVYPILQSGTDSAPQALEIVESYILLAPQSVLQEHYRVPLIAALKEALGYTTRQNTGVVPRLVEMLLRCCERVDGGSEPAFRDVSQTLVQAGFLSDLLAGLHSAHVASESVGPNRPLSNVSGVVETDYFSVLARIALADPNIFASAVSAATNPDQTENPYKNLPWLLKEWFFHYDNVSSVKVKKVHVFALSQLLTLKENPPTANPNAPASFLREFLQSYLTVWTDLILELADGGTDPDPDYLVYWNVPAGSETAQPEPTGERESAESHRRRDWDQSDLTCRITIRHFVRERLQDLIIACGGPESFQAEWLVNVDTHVVAAFATLGLI